MDTQDFEWGKPGLVAIDWSTIRHEQFRSSVDAIGFTQSGALGKSPALMSLELADANYWNRSGDFPIESDEQFRFIFRMLGNKRTVGPEDASMVFSLNSKLVLGESGVWTSISGQQLRSGLMLLNDLWEKGERGVPDRFTGWYRIPSRK